MDIQKYLQRNCRITHFKLLHFLFLLTTTVLSVTWFFNQILGKKPKTNPSKTSI